MLDHTEAAASNVELPELQTVRSCTVLDVVGRIQPANVVDHFPGRTANEQNTLVTNLRISCLIEDRIKSRFQLREGSSTASRRVVHHTAVGSGVVSSIQDDVPQAVHSTERLTISRTLRFRAEEQRLLDVSSMESGAIHTVFSNGRFASNHLRSLRRTRKCPGVAEDLRVVRDANRIDLQSVRTNRAFLESVPDLVQVHVVSNCGGSRTNTASNRHLSRGQNRVDDNNFTCRFSTHQHARQNIRSRGDSEHSISCTSDRCVQIDGRKQHGLGEETVFDLQSLFSRQHRSHTEQRRLAIRHEAGNHPRE